MLKATNSEDGEHHDQDPWLEHLRPTHIFVVVVGLWIIAPVALRWFFPEPGVRGQFGDAYGSLNALYSGLAFGAVLYAIILQRRELAVQQAELRLTRDEFKKNRSAQVLFQVMEDLRKLRPMWHRLYEFPADWRQWSEDQKALADQVGDGLQQVAYLCQVGLIDADFVMAGAAATFVKCWRKLAPFIEDYRVQCGEPARLADGAFQRRHLEEFVTLCEGYLREHHPKIEIGASHQAAAPDGRA